MAESEPDKKTTLRISPSAQREILNQALRLLPAVATAPEKQRAFDRGRAAMREQLEMGATLPDVTGAVTLAVRCVADEVHGRLRREYWHAHAADLLPWGADEEDKREAVKLALGLLDDLPVEMTDSEVREEIAEELKALCDEIKADQAIERLIEYGRGRVTTVLSRLHSDGVISLEKSLDSYLRRDLEEAVEEQFKDELDGEESYEEVDELVESIVADELDLEPIEDEPEGED